MSEYQPLPEGVDFKANVYGPCEGTTADNYLVVETNEIGPVQIHGCARLICGNAFLFSETYGWIESGSASFWARVTSQVQAAVTNRTPPWSKFHLGVANAQSKGGE